MIAFKGAIAKYNETIELDFADCEVPDHRTNKYYTVKEIFD